MKKNNQDVSSVLSQRSGSSKIRPNTGQSEMSNPSSVMRKSFSARKRRLGDLSAPGSSSGYDANRPKSNSSVVIADLESRLENALKDSALFKDRIAQQLERHSTIEKELVERYEFALRERDRQLDEYVKLVAQLQSEVLQASSYIKQQEQHEEELQDLRNQLKEAETQHEKELFSLKFEAIDRKMKLFAMKKAMHEEFQHVVEQKLRTLMEERYKGLIEENESLKKDKLDMCRDMDRLLTTTSTIGGELTDLQRSMKLHNNIHVEVLKHGVIRMRQERDKEVKLQRLELKVRELQAKLFDVHKTVSNEYRSQIHTLEEELKATKDALKTHRSQLQSMRQWASQVVRQRNDLEKFFYTALEDCRKYQTGINACLLAQKAHHSSINEPVYEPNKLPKKTVRTRTSHRGPLITASGNDADRPKRPIGGHVPFTMTPLVSIERTSKPFETTLLPELSQVTDRTPPLLDSEGAVHESTKLEAKPAVPTPPPMGAYIEEMSWEDKEKVIKALLFYINTTFPPTQVQPGT